MMPTFRHEAKSVTLLSRWCAAAIIVVGTSVCFAQQSEETRERVPALPMSYRGVPWLERDERADEERPDITIKAMNLKSGDVVVDLGCGSGYFTRPIAKLVEPDGKVYAVDIQPEMLDILGKALDDADIKNVIPVLGDVDDPKLPRGEADWVLLVDVYHEFQEPEPMLEKIRQSLAPGGRVALLEFRVEDGTGDHIKPEHRMSARQVLSEWKAAKFQLAELVEELPVQHFFIFTNQEDATAKPPVTDVDLIDAIVGGELEVHAGKAEPGIATIRIRAKAGEPLIVTAPAGTYITAASKDADAVLRRDAMIYLRNDEWQDWEMRAVLLPEGGGDRQESSERTFAIESTAQRPDLAKVMYHLQNAARSTLEVDRAAAWIAQRDISYAELLPVVDGERMPGIYAVAFGLVYYQEAGFDPKRRTIWNNAADIFEKLRDPGLREWYDRINAAQ